jgi:hypothetical protein
MASARFDVVKAFTHDGRRYEAGDDISGLTGDQAKRLVGLGVIARPGVAGDGEQRVESGEPGKAASAPAAAKSKADEAAGDGLPPGVDPKLVGV